MSDPLIVTRDLYVEERELLAAKAAVALAEARKANAEAEAAEHEAEVARYDAARARQKREREIHADDYEDYTYRFISDVNPASVLACINKLDAWHRAAPEAHITIIFDSPGGAVVPGFHLFDHILELRDGGQRIDTMTRGYAASMGGILLQAGEERLMGPNATLMIHEVSFGAQGKIGDVEDTTEFAKLLWNRALDIFADRAKDAGESASKRISRRALDSRSKRKNWWIKAEDALAFGLVDAIR